MAETKSEHHVLLHLVDTRGQDVLEVELTVSDAGVVFGAGLLGPGPALKLIHAHDIGGVRVELMETKKVKRG
jgi:Cu/Zn superoxide dismutase